MDLARGDAEGDAVVRHDTRVALRDVGELQPPHGDGRCTHLASCINFRGRRFEAEFERDASMRPWASRSPCALSAPGACSGQPDPDTIVLPMNSRPETSLVLSVPGWIDAAVAAFSGPLETDEDRMGLAILLSNLNIERGGGPFGAVVFAGPRVAAAGVNRVVDTGFSIAHAEIVALMRTQQALRGGGAAAAESVQASQGGSRLQDDHGALLPVLRRGRLVGHRPARLRRDDRRRGSHWLRRGPEAGRVARDARASGHRGEAPRPPRGSQRGARRVRTPRRPDLRNAEPAHGVSVRAKRCVVRA